MIACCSDRGGLMTSTHSVLGSACTGLFYLFQLGGPILTSSNYYLLLEYIFNQTKVTKKCSNILTLQFLWLLVFSLVESTSWKVRSRAITCSSSHRASTCATVNCNYSTVLMVGVTSCRVVGTSSAFWLTPCHSRRLRGRTLHLQKSRKRNFRVTNLQSSCRTKSVALTDLALLGSRDRLLRRGRSTVSYGSNSFHSCYGGIMRLIKQKDIYV